MWFLDIQAEVCQIRPIHKSVMSSDFFQGLEDKVVPPYQTEKMFNALNHMGLPASYIPFEGEQHGFRRAENIKRALDAELDFYLKVFTFSTD
jgi:dipeptidyl aminopeptidase/acylaminoacyl peptidase